MVVDILELKQCVWVEPDVCGFCWVGWGFFANGGEQKLCGFKQIFVQVFL